MKKALGIIGAATLVGALGVAAAPQVLIQVLGFTDIGGNDAIASIAVGRDSSDNPELNFRFTTSDTEMYTLLGTLDTAVTVGEFSVFHAFGGTVADHIDTIVFIADKVYTVTDIDAVWATAESTGSMDVMVERLQSTEACGSGDDLLSAAIDATGTANTVNTGSLTSTSASLELAAGDRLCIDLTATPNEIVNLVVTVGLHPS